jgi:ubiquinone/menaquinone biosynthesis C-methylase UbiE
MALFDDYAAGYDSWYATPRGQVAWRFELEVLLRALEPRSGEEVLDAGCGTGVLARELAARGVAVTGVDISGAMLGLAREKLRGEGVRLVHADIAALPFPHASYDAVVCFTVLEFLPHPEEALREMWRVLKPGGRLVLGVLNRLSVWALRRRGRGVFAHARFYTLWEMRRLIKETLPVSACTWAGGVYFPPRLPEGLLRYAHCFELAGRLVARPFGAVLVFRVEKDTQLSANN